MAKVVISKKNEAISSKHGLLFSDYDTTVDGIEIDKLTGFQLNMNVDEVNSCTLTFLVDDLEVDAEFVAALQAHIKAKEES